MCVVLWKGSDQPKPNQGNGQNVPGERNTLERYVPEDIQRSYLLLGLRSGPYPVRKRKTTDF